MATATHIVVPAPERHVPQVPAKPVQTAPEPPDNVYWGDWAGLLIWSSCAVLIILVTLFGLVCGLLR